MKIQVLIKTAEGWKVRTTVRPELFGNSLEQVRDHYQSLLSSQTVTARWE